MEVKVEKKKYVTTIIINRPNARNAVNPKVASELAQAFKDFEADENSRVAVLYGSGGSFCGGFDLKSVSLIDSNSDFVRSVESGSDGPMGPTRMEFTKPVIAAICGFAVAGGLELALMCDLRIVEEDSTFGVFCRRWGVPLIDGGTVRLPRLIGLSRALDMILTGRPISSSEAFQFGLANRVVPKGKAKQVAEELAASIAEYPQICMNSDRTSAYQQFGMGMKDALENEYKHGVRALKSADMKLGAESFAKGGDNFDLIE